MAPTEEANVTKPTGELRPDEKLNYEEDVKCSGSSSTTVGKTAYDTDDISQSQAAELQDLARQLSRASRQGGLDVENEPQQVINPFLDSESDAELNPDSKSFNVAKWLKTILQITSRDPERFPKRTAGVSFRNMNVHGYGTAADYQSDVGNLPLKAWSGIMSMLGLRKKVRIDILRDFEGLVKSGEMLVVLGRPGSGCSTLLRTLSGETHGLYLDEGNDIQYQGISWEQMHKNFRGEVIYQAETETHFPQMTVGDTLYFAARARAPANRLPGVSREQYAIHMRSMVMSMLSLSHTINTQVGNEYIRGVSGGERKRISIAETTLSGSPLQCWDNSTRGLDSANALEFVKSLRLSTKYSGTTAIVAIYQAGQAIYDIFDKAVVLYEGHQIYFGNAVRAKEYFIEMGFDCPSRQTTADFLTSVTSPSERRVRPGYESRVPQTPAEFAQRWKESEDRRILMQEIDEYNKTYPLHGEQLQKFQASRLAEKSRSTSKSSPYTLSYPMEIKLCMWRGFQRLKGDMSMTLTSIIGNIAMSLIIASVFYNQQETTDSFFSRGSLLFFAILMNAFASSLEILTLWHQRPIVEKHDKYALYHPSSEAISSILVDMPAKLAVAIVFNLIIYFMTNLRRTPGHFFIFFLFSFTTTLTMSNVFRSIAAVSRTLSQALVPTSIFMLALVIYTGFTIPVRDMRPWFKWISYINPIQYAFESLMINEFHDREFKCAAYIPSGPGYSNASGTSKICAAKGAMAGKPTVSGDVFLRETYSYYASHMWRNYGIIIAFFLFFLFVYITATELVSAKPSKGEILVFPKGKVPAFLKQSKKKQDPEAASTQEKQPVETSGHDQTAAIVKQTSVFHWESVCYDIKIKKESRRILDNVDGWVKPGTLTALMGVSGAGKTTLLDVLANRVTMGVVTGEMLVDGRLRDDSFQRKTGYVQQQDLHLEISTVREALTFSALLRQPNTTPYEEKVAYVEEVIKMLGMEEYANAVVGVLGEGLNVEQRKRLTIGVEIAAKPDLLLFFDEPTSGLDSQTAWSICTLMRKLADHGQAVLCTIHQPSAMLMQEFDRLLFLASGGRTVYFGELGKHMSTLIEYFESKGAPKCPPDANPAEWMLEVIGAAPGSKTDIDWPAVWRDSAERVEVRRHLAELKSELSQKPQTPRLAGYGEFAMPLWKQYLIVQHRMFQQYWRSPDYIYSKACLAIVPTLFIGFTFYKEQVSLQGIQNQMFAFFMFMILFPNLVQQMMPYFVIQRSLYEVRERPSKTYSWIAFMISSVVVEIPWNALLTVPAFFCWYYPIGFYKNAIPTDAVTERSGTMFLLILIFLMFSSTFSSMVIAGIEQAETGGNIAQLCFSLTLVFCGVLVSPTAMPGFWIFMYRLSPFTYFVSAVLSTGVGRTDIVCAANEILRLTPAAGQTCMEYLGPYTKFAGGRILTPDATDMCEFCAVADTDTFLKGVNIIFDERWRNIGILFGYIAFNMVGAIGLYWLLRVPKRKSGVKQGQQPQKQANETKA
ncbi:hypothetical protein H106_06691 [Trichophyton rubrum CBS 735.88]|nr:hypothetical protein H106_06691 [Trichophyton rubrum CBS 735.88]